MCFFAHLSYFIATTGGSCRHATKMSAKIRPCVHIAMEAQVFCSFGIVEGCTSSLAATAILQQLGANDASKNLEKAIALTYRFPLPETLSKVIKTPDPFLVCLIPTLKVFPPFLNVEPCNFLATELSLEWRDRDCFCVLMWRQSNLRSFVEPCLPLPTNPWIDIACKSWTPELTSEICASFVSPLNCGAWALSEASLASTRSSKFAIVPIRYSHPHRFPCTKQEMMSCTWLTSETFP